MRLASLCFLGAMGLTALGCTNASDAVKEPTSSATLSRNGEADPVEASCEQHPSQCLEVAHCYASGECERPRDPSRATELLRRACVGASEAACVEACKAGVSSSCARQAVLFELGRAPELAGQLLQTACDANDLDACVDLSLHCYAEGACGAPADPSRMPALLVRACEGGSPLACHHLAACFEAGECGVDADQQRAATLFQNACDGGISKACTHLAACYLTGECGLDVNEAEAGRLFEWGCHNAAERDFAACFDLGTCYADARCGLPHNVEVAVELYELSCANEILEGCEALAGCLHEGSCGVDRDDTRADQLYRRACPKKVGWSTPLRDSGVADFAVQSCQACYGGDADACSTYAGYLEGHHDDIHRSRELLQRGCDGGASSACSKLADCYKTGSFLDRCPGFVQNEQLAGQLYEKACELSKGKACGGLASCIDRGSCGFKKDRRKAAELYRQSCGDTFNGDEQACIGLARCYEVGDCGFKKEAKLAAKIYAEICDRGHAMACSALAHSPARLCTQLDASAESPPAPLGVALQPVRLSRSACSSPKMFPKPTRGKIQTNAKGQRVLTFEDK